MAHSFNCAKCMVKQVWKSIILAFIFRKKLYYCHCDLDYFNEYKLTIVKTHYTQIKITMNIEATVFLHSTFHYSCNSALARTFKSLVSSITSKVSFASVSEQRAGPLVTIICWNDVSGKTLQSISSDKI